MFLKNRKILPLICCMLAALCLSAGAVLSNSGNGGNNVYETMVSSEVEETKAAIAGMELPEVIAVEEEEAAIVPETGGESDSTAFFGRLLFAGGIVLATLFIFFMRQNVPFLGPEIEGVLLFLSLFMIRQSFHMSVAGYVGYLWLMYYLLLVCARGLWSWLRSRFQLNWSAANRLGMLVAGTSKKQSRYLYFQIVFSVLWLVIMVIFLSQARLDICFGLLSAGCLFGTVLSGLCFMRRARDMDHLVLQMAEFHDGNEVSVRDGAFAREEEMLIDLNRQRDEAVQKAIVSERFRVDLIANVSHDLRTPLTAIMGYGELLQEETLSPKGEKQLAELNRKAGYMRDLVESLFELTKVSSGAAKSRMAEIDLIRLLEQTLGLFDDQLKGKNLQVRRHYEMDSLPVVTDGARMHQVFANLVGNAIKYTLPGTRIHLEVRDGGQAYVIRMMNVASYEMDFNPEEITERFVRGDKARTTKGSGLGLAIARTYTESVGGSFKVEIDGEQFSAIVALPKDVEKKDSQ